MPLAKMHAFQDRHASSEWKKHHNQSHHAWSVLAHPIVSPSCSVVLAPQHATYCAACNLDSLGGVPGEYGRDALHNSCHVDPGIVIVYEFADPFHLLHRNEEGLERHTPRCQVYSEVEGGERGAYSHFGVRSSLERSQILYVDASPVFSRSSSYDTCPQ